MRRWVRSIALAGLVVFVILVGRKGYQDYAAARAVAEREKTIHWLNSLIIPRLDFREASLEEMVAFLNQHIASAQGRPKGLHIEIAGTNEMAGFHPLVPEEKEPVSLAEGGSGEITVELTALPMIEALKYVTGISKRTFEIRSRLILVHPIPPLQGTFDPLVTRTFILLRGVEKTLFGASEQTATTIDVAEGLRRNGMKFYKGSYAEFDPRGRTLRVRNTESQISVVETCADCFGVSMSDRVIRWIESWIPGL